MEIENNENENNNQVEQIPNSLQGEINLVGKRKKKIRTDQHKKNV